MNLIEWVHSLLDGAGAFIKKMINKAKPFLQKEIPVAVGVINLLKMAVDSGIGTYIAALTPTQLDDMLVEKAKTFLPDIIIKLKILQLNEESPDNTVVIKGMIDFLASLDPKSRFGYYKMLGDYLVDALADGELKWSEVVILTEMVHDGKVDGVQPVNQ